MSKPHVTILHYTAPPVVGGVENVIAQHTRLLIDAGYPVTIVTGRGGQDRALARSEVVVIPEIDSQYPGNLQVARALEQEKVPFEFESLENRIKRLLAPIWSNSDTLVVHNALCSHLNLPLTAALHDLSKRGPARRLIAWCHDVSRYVNQASGIPQRFGFPWDLLRTSLPDVTYVTVSSQRQRTLAQALRCSSDLIHVVPNGVDARNLLGLSDFGQHLVEEFRLFEADLILLMPIRITRAKNIECALQVTAAIKDLGLRPRLLVTGPPDPHSRDGTAYLQQLLALRHEMLLDQEAIFLYEGTSRFPRPLEIEPNRVGELYRLCDVVLITSEHEGFSLPVLEGAMADKPVFTTRVPVLEDIGADGAHCIEQGESAAHVAARIKTWAERDTAHRLRRRVRKEYTWSALFRHVIEPLVAECVPAG